MFKLKVSSSLRAAAAAVAAAILSASLAFPVSAEITQEDRDKYENNKTVQGYNDDIAAYERRQRELRDELKSLGNDIDDAVEKKDAYDELIEVTEGKIAATEALIAKYEEESSSLADDISEGEQKSAELYEQIKERIRVSYESNGSATYLELLFGAESFSELVAGIDSAVRLMEYDTSLMKSYNDTVAGLEADKAESEDNLRRQSELREQLADEKEEAEELRAECEALIAKLTKDEADAKALIKEFDEKIDEASKKLDAYIEELIKREGIKQSVAEGEFMWPLPTKYTNITSTFGPRVDPFGSGVIDGHGGTDIYCPKGTDVYASNNGKVLRAEKDSSYGNYILLDHGGGIYTLYAHCSQLLVKVGDTVKKGDVIAKSGDTGHVTGPHLHFEVRENGTRVDAMGYVKKP